MYNTQYPHRVTRGDDGVYRWLGQFSDEQKRKVVKITLGVCGACCLVLLAMGYYLDGFGSMFGVMLLSCLGVMAIAGLICLLYYRGSGTIWQPYELTEEYVRYVGSTKTNVYFYFRQIRRVKVSAEKSLIEVASLLTTAPILVPPEDFRFVEDYILNRLPESTEVVFK